MMPKVKVVHASEFDLLYSVAELRRRLRYASVLLAAVQLPSLAPTDRAAVLLRTRGHLSGTLHKLAQLAADANRVPDPIEDQLTEPIDTTRIATSP